MNSRRPRAVSVSPGREPRSSPQRRGVPGRALLYDLDRGRRWRRPGAAPGRDAACVPVRHPHRGVIGQRYLRVRRGAHHAAGASPPPRGTRRAGPGRRHPRPAAPGGPRARRGSGGRHAGPARVPGVVRHPADVRRRRGAPGCLPGRQPRRRALVEPPHPADAPGGWAGRRGRAVVPGELRVAARAADLLRARQPVRPGQHHHRLRQPAGHPGGRPCRDRTGPAGWVGRGGHPKHRPAGRELRLPPGRDPPVGRGPDLLPVPRPGAPLAARPPGGCLPRV
jgi:hypothetical protein